MSDFEADSALCVCRTQAPPSTSAYFEVEYKGAALLGSSPDGKPLVLIRSRHAHAHELAVRCDRGIARMQVGRGAHAGDPWRARR